MDNKSIQDLMNLIPEDKRTAVLSAISENASPAGLVKVAKMVGVDLTEEQAAAMVKNFQETFSKKGLDGLLGAVQSQLADGGLLGKLMDGIKKG